MYRSHRIVRQPGQRRQYVPHEMSQPVARTRSVCVCVCICVTILHLEAHYCSSVRNSPESTCDRCTSTEYLLFQIKKVVLLEHFWTKRKKSRNEKVKREQKIRNLEWKENLFCVERKKSVLFCELRYDSIISFLFSFLASNIFNELCVVIMGKI